MRSLIHSRGRGSVSRAPFCLLVAFVLVGCVEEDVAVPESPPASMDLIYQGPPEAPPNTRAPATPRARVTAQQPNRPAHIIRTCRAPDGSLSFRDSPCADGSSELDRRIVEPEAPDAARRAAESQAAALNDARRVAEIAYGNSVRRSSSRQVAYDDREARCEAARVQAKKIRDQYWNRMTYDWSQQIDAWVHAVCANTTALTRWNTMPMGPMRSGG